MEILAKDITQSLSPHPSFTPPPEFQWLSTSLHRAPAQPWFLCPQPLPPRYIFCCYWWTSDSSYLLIAWGSQLLMHWSLYPTSLVTIDVDQVSMQVFFHMPWPLSESLGHSGKHVYHSASRLPFCGHRPVITKDSKPFIVSVSNILLSFHVFPSLMSFLQPFGLIRSNSLLKKVFSLWEFQVKFYLGQNEDCNLGDSIPDSYEKLLRGGEGRN